VICGYGEVGRKVSSMLHDAGEPVLVVNDQDDADVKIVGNVLDPEVLVHFEEDFRIQKDDQIFLCGSPQSIDSYLQIFPQLEICTPDEVS